jgi:plastocyanin
MRILILAVVVAAMTFAGPTAADNPGLVGTVGPGYSISLATAAGTHVSTLDPGTYSLVVHDMSDIHNFHLTGPGVNVATDIDFVGDKTFTITVADGKYVYLCDAHPASMVGRFTGGTPAPTPTPVPTKAIAARVGPGKTLVFPARLAKGKYAISVRDLSARDNLHLKGPGVDRKTGVAFKGAAKWTVTLKTGTYRVWSDAHKTLARTVKVA